MLPSSLRQRVFVERQPHLLRARAQHDAVLLAPREILQRRAVTFRRQRPQIHLQPLQPELDAGLVRTLPQHFMRPRMHHEFLHRLRRARPRHQQIQIARPFP